MNIASTVMKNNVRFIKGKVDRIYKIGIRGVYPLIIMSANGDEFFTAITNKKVLKNFLRVMNPKKYADNHSSFFIKSWSGQDREVLSYRFSEKEIIISVDEKLPLKYEFDENVFSFEQITERCFNLPEDYHKSGAMFFAASNKWKCIYIEDLLPKIKDQIDSIEGFANFISVKRSNGLFGGYVDINFEPNDVGDGTTINPRIFIDARKIYNKSVSVKVFLTVMSCSNVLTFEGWDYIRQYATEHKLFRNLCNRKVHRGDELDFSFLNWMFVAVNDVGLLFGDAKIIPMSSEDAKDLLMFYNGKHKISAKNATRAYNEFVRAGDETLFGLVMAISWLSSSKNNFKIPNNTKHILSTIAGEILMIGENLEVFLSNVKYKPLMKWDNRKFVTNRVREKPQPFVLFEDPPVGTRISSGLYDEAMRLHRLGQCRGDNLVGCDVYGRDVYTVNGHHVYSNGRLVDSEDP